MNKRLSATLLLLGLIAGQYASAEPFTADHLVRLDRVGAPSVSPDSQFVVYTLRKTDMDADKGRYNLWLSSIDGGEPRQLTSHEANDTDPAWSPDGSRLVFATENVELKPFVSIEPPPAPNATVRVSVRPAPVCNVPPAIAMPLLAPMLASAL